MTTISPAELRENFDHFDSNGDGCIELHEFETLMPALGFEGETEALHLGFREIDTDNSGLVEFDEFARWFGEN